MRYPPTWLVLAQSEYFAQNLQYTSFGIWVKLPPWSVKYQLAVVLIQPWLLHLRLFKIASNWMHPAWSLRNIANCPVRSKRPSYLGDRSWLKVFIFNVRLDFLNYCIRNIVLCWYKENTSAQNLNGRDYFAAEDRGNFTLSYLKRPSKNFPGSCRRALPGSQ